MKRDGIIHPGLIELIASLGHNDEILICDAGYPIPAHLPRIDLGYRRGDPPFLDVLGTIASELFIDAAVAAAEASEELCREIERTSGAELQRMPHADLKQRVLHCKAAVRTGEYRPYANVLLVAGVAFS